MPLDVGGHVAGVPLGSLLNAAAVVAGGLLGLLVGGRLPERVKQAVLSGIGLVVLVIAVQAALLTTNAVIPLVSVVVGGALGEWLRIEERVEGVGTRLRDRFAPGEDGRGDRGFVEGFVTLTLIAVVGPLTVLGTFQEGIDGSIDLLVVKTALDGLVAIPLAAVYGIGVAFSALGILAVQVPMTVVGALVGEVLSDRMLVELEATGGVVIIGIGLRLLDLKRLPVASYLPALVVAPLIVAALGD